MSTQKRKSGAAGIDVGAAMLQGLNTFGSKIQARRDKVEKFENESNDRHNKVVDKLKEMDSLDQSKAMTDLTDVFNKEIDDLHRLDIASFDGDRTEYNTKLAHLTKAIDEAIASAASFDQDQTAFQNLNEKQKAMQIRRLDKNDPLYAERQKYRKAVEHPEKVSYRYDQDKGLIMTYDDGSGTIEDMFTARGYTNSKKDEGFSLVDLVTDHEDKLTAISDKYSKELDDLTTVETTQETNDDGSVTTKYKDPSKAYDKYIELLDSPDNTEVLAMVNADNYQRFVAPDDVNMVWNGSEDQQNKTKKKVIEYLANKKFPNQAKIVTSQSTVEDNRTKEPKDTPINFNKNAKKFLFKTDSEGNQIKRTNDEIKEDLIDRLIKDNPGKYFRLKDLFEVSDGKATQRLGTGLNENDFKNNPNAIYVKKGEDYVPYTPLDEKVTLTEDGIADILRNNSKQRVYNNRAVDNVGGKKSN